MPGDSAMLRAYFECDSLNNVLMRSFTETKSGKVESSLSFSGGALDYKAATKPDTVYLPSDSVFIDREIPVTVEVDKEVNKPTKWQKTRMRAGDLFISILCAIVLWRVIKWYINFKKIL